MNAVHWGGESLGLLRPLAGFAEAHEGEFKCVVSFGNDDFEVCRAAHFFECFDIDIDLNG